MVELKAVQIEALRQAEGRPGFGFWLEQGLMKTGTAITEFHRLKERNLVDAMCVVCPNTIKTNWRDEVIDVYGYPYRVGVWPDCDPRKKGEDPDVLIVNYEALLGKGYDAVDRFVQSRRVYMPADESTRIKSHAAQTTKKMLMLAKYVPFTRSLTGTPMTQSVMDLWPQLRYIGELNGVNPYAFRNHFAVLGGYMGKQVVGTRNEPELQRLLNGCSFRALKKDWLKDLPEKMPPVIRDVTMTAEQKIVYDEMREDFFTLVKRQEISANQVITQMERLAQISRGFLYDENHKAIELVPPEHNPCVKELLNLLEQSTGKVIIFTVHRYTTDMLRMVLPNAAYIVSQECMRETGSNVDEQKNKFNKDPACRHIICQLSVASMGHTLLGGTGNDRCATTIFFENSYKLLDRMQGEDRNHRQGQDKGVSYFDISASPIDRKVIKAIHKKADMVAAIIDAVKTTT